MRKGSAVVLVARILTAFVSSAPVHIADYAGDASVW
jgi:hypothetical protein